MRLAALVPLDLGTLGRKVANCVGVERRILTRKATEQLTALGELGKHCSERRPASPQAMMLDSVSPQASTSSFEETDATASPAR